MSSKSYVYIGLAGETGPRRPIKSGLYRMAADDGVWKSLGNGLPDSPAIRSITVHPTRPEVVFVGTQHGPYRSEDHGDHWERAPIADHGLPVWSVMFHPRDPQVMYAGYENCEIFRSDDGGEHWAQLPVSVRFPEVTVGPGANLAKRVLMMSGSASNPDEIYGAIEVGGIIRSLDGGDHWENLSHGQYINDDYVDMHGVLASTFRPDTVLSIGRAGMFRSSDRGDHWQAVGIESLNAKGQTYCRCIREVPGDPKSIWVSGGGNFRSDVGALFRSGDGGISWERVDMGFQPTSTMFGIAFDRRRPGSVYCATSSGQVYGSQDDGGSWREYPTPEGVDQVYALACG